MSSKHTGSVRKQPWLLDWTNLASRQEDLAEEMGGRFPFLTSAAIRTDSGPYCRSAGGRSFPRHEASRVREMKAANDDTRSRNSTTERPLTAKSTGPPAMKSANRKVIISCAITGATHVPSMSQYLPITPDEIAARAIAAAEAGAAILHLHARDPSDGRPTPSRPLHRVLAGRSSGHGCGHQHHDRRSHADDDRRTARASAAREAGDVLAQHGLDELRTLS